MFANTQHRASGYYVSGIFRLESERSSVMTSVAVVGAVAEAVQRFLLKDSRFANQKSTIRNRMRRQTLDVCNIPGGVWARLVSCTGSPCEYLRNSCVAANHISCAFFELRVLGSSLHLTNCI